jgi:hypothetical protein
MTLSFDGIRKDANRFLESMRTDQSFLFRFSADNKPNLIGSALAVMLTALLGLNESLTEQEKNDWADYLNSFQRKDGFFEDEDISDENRVSGYTKERALFHRTRHVLFALATLGYKPKNDFLFLEDKMKPGAMKKWMDELDLSDFWDASNKIMDLALFLSYEALANESSDAKRALDVLIDICDENTDAKTGYQDAGKSERRNAMAGAMHIYPVYFMWRREPKYPERVLETTLSLQQSDGFFAYETKTCGEDCLDYDAVNIIVNFSFIHNGYDKKIKKSLTRLLDAIESCKNSDGGFCCHRRDENYRFGTFTTEVPVGGSSLWSTYSRILTIAMAGKVLSEHPASGDWNLGNNIMELWDGGSGKMRSYHNFSGLKDTKCLF